MDQLYKIPISHGEIDNRENYTTACALFWFKDFDSMMSTKGLEHPLHFQNSLKAFFDPEDEGDGGDGGGLPEDRPENMVLNRTRSTFLNQDMIQRLVSECKIRPPDRKLLETLKTDRDTLECAILDIKLNK